MAVGLDSEILDGGLRAARRRASTRQTPTHMVPCILILAVSGENAPLTWADAYKGNEEDWTAAESGDVLAGLCFPHGRDSYLCKKVPSPRLIPFSLTLTSTGSDRCHAGAHGEGDARASCLDKCASWRGTLAQTVCICVLRPSTPGPDTLLSPNTRPNEYSYIDPSKGTI